MIFRSALLRFILAATATLHGIAGAAVATPRTQELTVASGDVRLVGTLYLPAGEGPFPAVVMTHGSEPASRAMAGYIRWATLFSEGGVATLITDKRGVGDSGGTYVEAPDLAVPARDLVVWVEKLRTLQVIRPDAVGVHGVSQGGWVGPLSASMSRSIAFIVAVSAPGVSPLEQNIFDKTNQAEAAGLTPDQVERFSKTIRRVWTYLATGEGHTEAQGAWDAVAGEEWFRDVYDGAPMMDRDLVLQDPRMIHFAAHSTYDPEPVLRRVRVPLLAVYGGADRITPVEVSLERMKEAFREGGNTRVTFRVFEGADHGIHVPPGSRHYAEGYADLVLSWMRDVTGTASPAAR